METTSKYTIAGFTNAVTVCECCGKSELKGTFVMIDENGDDFYFGSVCGARAAGITTKKLSETVKQINLNNEVEKMANNAKSEYAKHEVLKFIAKKKLDVIDFVKKHGVEICGGWHEYGARTFNTLN